VADDSWDSRAAEAAKLEELAAQETELVLDRFDNDDAWRLGVQLVEAARAQDLAVSITIRRGGQRLFHASLPGTSPDNDSWLDRKCRVVERIHQSSFHVGTSCRASGRTFTQVYDLDVAEYAAHGGAFPLTVRGVGVVGAVAVSGLPQAQDHAFVVQQLRRFIGSRR
jgi:uncharacterized protein (UPF0303 family)